jgi:KEOPS complex subunit Pcc1
VKSATITIEKNEATADVVARSLHPETQREIPRSVVKISEDDSFVHIEIAAQDTSSLRAALNSYLRWMKITEDTYWEIKGKKN